MRPTEEHGHHRPPKAAILMIPVLAALLLTLFAWPAARIEPRDLPIGVAGPAPAAAAIESRLAEQPGAFSVERYADGAEARDAIRDREVYGAFLATPDGLVVLNSTAASPVVAQLLTNAAEESGASGVRDVAPATRAGAALPSSVLPLVLAGILTGVMSLLLTTSGLGRIGLVAAGSIGAGLAGALIVQSWLDVVSGDWLTNAAVLSLTIGAIGSIVAGLGAAFGKTGAAAGALLMILIGNPFAAAGSAPELLPEPVGGIGQLLPPGAGANLLRSTGFFDGAGSGEHLLVLALWALAGLACLAVPALRARRGGAPVAEAAA